MAKKQGRSLGYMTLQRFVVLNCPQDDNKKRKRGARPVYTSVVDAMIVARRCSRPNEYGVSRRIDVLYGLPGNEARIASCEERKCRTPGGQPILMRKLYDMEQRGPAATAFDETVRRRKHKGSAGSASDKRRVQAKARKTKAKKKTMPKWKSTLIARAKARGRR